ncbi:cation:proton antiporter [Methylobacterium oxalidis]|uniref:Cation transporter n=1 Tax=Methylobacterium oxalidis TaxID=944322 RepID=A0A512J9A0_9HYPH|nr:cation:proton antiporter [Methylobacterium oxalidis]GEP06485.1 cation transporter [Methylobacterium oxalidis]GJE33495.1 K(+)/H(+) antiporter NhaP2 [Methylobacterium oxalidis]GLS65525.1 cation transporter [Methylobacterium oxalidis]
MNVYVLALGGFGALVLLTAWLPMVLRQLPLSLPIVCVGIGAALSSLPFVAEAVAHPREHLHLVERLSEFVVIVSLMGAGLKLDRLIGWQRWIVTWRLLGIAMPLTILALAFLASTLLGLGAAAAVLLAGALAPTDPVLASDVQVGPPQQGQEDEMRFALTSEAGLNDGLAFPFVHLAIALAAAEGFGLWQLGEWFAIAVLWKIAVGVALGALIGRGLGWLTFHLPNNAKLSRTGDGFVALGVTCMTYAAVEIAHGYGFIGVFVAAVALRSAHHSHDYHHKMHDYAEELERLLMMVLLVGFGAALIGGGLLKGLTWEAALYAGLALFIVRPVCGWLSLLGTNQPTSERAVISFFGIRGLGTIYYLAYGLNHAVFEQADLLWSTAGLTILISILLHGVTVTPVLRFLDRRSGRDTESAQLGLPLPS